MVESFDRKLQFLAKQLAWIGFMFLVLPICLWGLFLGWQYRHDTCVKSNVYYEALDWWLSIISLYNMFFMLAIMLMLCCHVSGRVRRWFIWPLHLLNILWNSVGIYLIIMSENTVSCDHNELWIFSVVIVTLTLGVAVFSFIGFICNRIGLCHRLGHLLSSNDDDNQTQFPQIFLGQEYERKNDEEAEEQMF